MVRGDEIRQELASSSRRNQIRNAIDQLRRRKHQHHRDRGRRGGQESAGAAGHQQDWPGRPHLRRQNLPGHRKRPKHDRSDRQSSVPRRYLW